MADQETCPSPVIVTLPAQIDAATAEQISAAFTSGATVVIADLTATAYGDWNGQQVTWQKTYPSLCHLQRATGPVF